MELKVKMGDKEVYVHYLPLDKSYALVAESTEKIKLFKVDIKSLDVTEKQLDAYLLGQVEGRLY